MANHRIVCTVQVPTNHPTTNAHIVEVGTGTDPNKASQRWKLDEVIAAMDRGEVFYTQGVTSGKTALVEKWYCAHCGRYYIRTKADAVHDNNLDSLRICHW